MASTSVTTFEGGFKEEHLELQPSEVASWRAAAGCEEAAVESSGDEEDVTR